jgi:PKD repeat protein
MPSDQEKFMSIAPGPIRRLLTLVTAIATAAVGSVVLATSASAAADALPSPPPLQQRDATLATADQLPTVQLDDGVAWSQAVVGNSVYVAGSFANARPAGAAAGTNLIPRANLLAYDIRTGVLNGSFAPQLNAQARVVRKSPDGTRIYVGGDFTTADGQTRYKVAAYSTATGQLIPTFKPVIGGSYVVSLAATNTTVYVGGLFQAAGGVTRSNLAAFSASTGATMNWAPTTDLQVDAMVMTPDNSKLIIGGRFSTVNGMPQRGMAALDPTSGAKVPWAAPDTIKNGSGSGIYKGKAGIYSLSADASTIYGTGWLYATANEGNLEGTFAADPNTGSIKWIEDCHGDTYASYSDGTNVYTLSHAHYCGAVGGFPQSNPWGVNMRHAIAFTAAVKGTLAHDAYAGGTYFDWFGAPAPAMINWFPDFYTGKYTGQGQAAWTVEGNQQYVVLGGEFPGVNGAPQYGLTRFATRPTAPGKQTPRLSGATWVPSVRSLQPGTAKVSFQANWDRDDMNLTYKVVRNGDIANPVYTAQNSSSFWNLPGMAFTDSGLTPGSTYSYRIYASDADGNTAASDPVSVTVSAGSPSAYAQRVLDDGAGLYWRLDESSGAQVEDWAGTSVGTAAAGVTRGAAGAISADTDTASTFSGSSTGTVVSQNVVTGPDTYTAGAWFKTTTGSGGKILGFGNGTTGPSTSYDRHVYMDDAGRIWFGVFPGAVRTVNSTGSYNDGRWHQVMTSVGADGMTLWVDGAQVASRSDVTASKPYSGSWRVGGDNLGGWPNPPSSNYFAGSIDEVAVYDKVLSSQTVLQQYQIGTGTASNQLPSAKFTAVKTGLKVDVDGSTSSDPDGTIASYRWVWGDSTPNGSGATATHTYAAAGTYTVTLTVTDNSGGTASQQQSVTVAAANQLPTAAFTVVKTGLKVDVDGSTSSDPDGTIASYRWVWGDSTPNGSGATATHTYAAAGTYTVTLTVTDNSGGTKDVSHDVVVAAQGTGPIAADAFGRTSPTGWGTADAGGTWTIAGSADLYRVGSGVGTISMVKAAQGPYALLNSVSAQDVDMTVDVSLDKVPNGNGVSAWLIVRHTTTADYRLKVSWTAAGQVTMYLVKQSGGTETNLVGGLVAGVTGTDVLRVRFQATGNGTTTLKGKLWKASTPEPAAWLQTIADTTAGIQAPGGVGLRVYSASNLTNFPIAAAFDNLAVGAPAGP